MVASIQKQGGKTLACILFERPLIKMALADLEKLRRMDLDGA